MAQPPGATGAPTATSYRALRPPAVAAAAVACLWTSRIGLHSPPTRVLPDGCADVVWQSGVGVFVAGPDTRPWEAVAPPATEYVGIRFRPGAAGAALGVDLCDLRDRRVDPGDLAGRLADDLPDRLPAWLPPGLALRRMAALAVRLAAAPPDRAVTRAVELLDIPGARVDLVARELGLTDRHLRRRCDAAVGYGPKTLARVLRFRRFLRRLDAGEAAGGLARIASEAGFADQAHLTRESRALAGLTPGDLLRERGAA